MGTDALHIETRRLDKAYGGVHALRDVSLAIERAEIHALVGENGAGKSTFAKIVAGSVRPSSGELIVDGSVVELLSPRQAMRHGIAMIEQELSIIPQRSVLDNVFVGRESSYRGGVFNGREQRRRFQALIDRSGFDLDPDAIVGDLRVADVQKVEILRALSREARLIIMDEPTAPLTRDESERLYAVVRSLQQQGTTIIFISHFLDEVLGLCDRVTIMRDGAVVRTSLTSSETPATLVEGMLGRSLELTFPQRRAPVDGPPVLEVRGLTADGVFEDVGFELRAGEIVGVAGLVGSGRSEIARTIFGAEPYDSGEILLDGVPFRPSSPADAVRRGIAMLPESRKDDGLIMTRSVAENLTLVRLARLSGGGVVRRSAIRRCVRDIVDQLQIRCDGFDAPIMNLSGGNQQKVLFGKWLLSEPRVFIVDEPTRGVDVGAKRAIYELVSALADEGMAVMLISSELEEVLGLADRVLVMSRGRLATTLVAEEATEEAVLAAAFSGAPA